MITPEDAAYVVVLDRYARTHRLLGGMCTTFTAEKIALFAAALDMAPSHTATELGFASDVTCSPGIARRAETRLRATGKEYLAHRLWLAVGDLSVAEVEAFTLEQPMAVADAVYMVTLFHFANRCKGRGQPMTMQAAEKIAVIACELGVRPCRTPGELGFDDDFNLPKENQHQAIGRVMVTRSAPSLDRLRQRLQGLTVADVEAYEPEGTDDGHT